MFRFRLMACTGCSQAWQTAWQACKKFGAIIVLYRTSEQSWSMSRPIQLALNRTEVTHKGKKSDIFIGVTKRNSHLLPDGKRLTIRKYIVSFLSVVKATRGCCDHGCVRLFFWWVVQLQARVFFCEIRWESVRSRKTGSECGVIHQEGGVIYPPI